MSFLLGELFEDIPTIHIVDVGASPIDGQPPYQRLVALGKAKVVGFEPNPAQYQLLQKQQNSFLTFFPYAVGDGKEGTLNICSSSGMSSLLEPDLEILNHFHGFGEWGKVIHSQKVSTRRLDDIEEIQGVDYLKLDVQGSELSVIKGASRRLQDTLVIHIEVQFVPFYKEQPLFAELDQALREAGFYLHCFTPLVCRTFKPLIVNDNIYAGLNQVLWTDAVYVKKFTDFSQLSSHQLLKIAFVMHEVYGSFDLCSLALQYVDRKENSNRQLTYLHCLTGQEK